MASRFARLSTGDRTFLRVEYAEAPEHVAGLCTMDGSALRMPTGALDLDLIRRRIASRLSRVPKLRQKAWRPQVLGGGDLWVDDPDFAIERHVRSTRVPAPGDEARLLDAAEVILQSPLDRAHPLWELWLLDGLEDGRVAALFKIHHAVADGLGAVALVSALLDFEPDADDLPSVPWIPARRPAWRDLVFDNLSTRVAALARVIAHPLRTARAAGTVLAESRHVLAGMNAAPRSSLNAPASGSRQARVVRIDLETARSVAHMHGAKINDIVLAVIASGIHELLAGRGEDDRALELMVMIAATLRRAEEAGQLGNVSGGYLARIPLGASDVLRRIEDVASATRAAKANERPTTNQRLLELVGRVGLIRWLGEHQHTMNVMTTNVPGPPVPLFLLGSRLDDVVAFITPVGNITLAFAALSYCGTLNILVNADARACPDVDVLATGMTNAWLGMQASVVSAA